ncbi:hypothetical protein SERLA73DRAFT_157893 [Serpula lacrymans var. lacrymans S7.3]|uniref:Major facilitator superfamily (MFS) profile domain-containing protein n=1 Tax=Serpula lacrymans var. lacrymans (strain S7.3) TaxID=936435 RepID=F8PFZ1_SERL3|nr:hypothetical protein SERLA73DRAFT_157893 [Serpula lacrymans var. lacrymans S7.3]
MTTQARDRPESVVADLNNASAPGQPEHEITAVQEKGIKGEIAVEKPYSIYTHSEKWIIVSIASVAGLFSPLTSNIYFPAIPTIATAFHKSIELINLTVTVYLVLQGVSPMFWGTMADRLGRRPIFLVCLFVLCLACVGLALVPTSDYWLLMLLRCLQSAGSASTVALGAGVIGDIATRSERGGFFGLYSMGPMVGPSIGPVIGGALAGSLGWRSIFWFLCISTAVCLAFMIAILPETLRRLVGDGSVVPSRIYRPLIPIVGRGRINYSAGRPSPQPLTNPLRIFTYPDVAALLFFNGVIYAVFYGITTSISSLFVQAYPFLTETDVGLCFLAIGGGMMFGSIFMGRFLDRDYKSMKNQMIRKAEADPEHRINPEDVTMDEHFPIEMARLRTIPIYLVIFAACTIGYGWCLQERVNLAGPLILQIILGYTMISVMNTVQTLLVDLLPTQSSSVTACNNLVRCSLGAAVVSTIDLALTAIGMGWTYVLFGCISLAVGPIIWFVIWIGPRCRAQRRLRSAIS